MPSIGCDREHEICWNHLQPENALVGLVLPRPLLPQVSITVLWCCQKWGYCSMLSLANADWLRYRRPIWCGGGQGLFPLRHSYRQNWYRNPPFQFPTRCPTFVWTGTDLLLHRHPPSTSLSWATVPILFALLQRVHVCPCEVPRNSMLRRNSRFKAGSYLIVGLQQLIKSQQLSWVLHDTLACPSRGKVVRKWGVIGKSVGAYAWNFDDDLPRLLLPWGQPMIVAFSTTKRSRTTPTRDTSKLAETTGKLWDSIKPSWNVPSFSPACIPTYGKQDRTYISNKWCCARRGGSSLITGPGALAFDSLCTWTSALVGP